MKTFIVGLGALILSVFVYFCVHDIKTYQRYNFDLKFVCVELSATGALYYDKEAYGNGLIVFNQTEANKAIRDEIKTLMTVDDSLKPLPNSYWTDRIELKLYFLDDSNTTYPYLYVDTDSGYTRTITCPTVIVTIDAGQGRFYFPSVISPGKAIRSGAHEWKAR